MPVLHQLHCFSSEAGGLQLQGEADTIHTDAIPTDDRDKIRVLGIGLVVGLRLVTVLQSSFVGTKSVGIASVGTESVGIASV